MGNVYLVRHGQAGTRDDYDSLSELGKQQTRLLGEYFVSQGIQFNATFCGGMQRQKETVKNVSSSLTNGEGNGNILIATSATPAAVLSGLALDIDDARVRQLAGVLYNSSYTVLRMRAGKFHLFQFNAVPHLTEPELRTHR